ncbi:MAG: ORF6N domain-containing protein [Bacteroidetes bacterium]|nr:MAG: ORF6N domain-containing protein [Bacteroidota bacterium]
MVPLEVIAQKIFFIRNQKVMLDKDLAELYGVETRALNRMVKRNLDRFPADFMIQLSKEEFQNLMYHFGTSSFEKVQWGGTRKLPYAFTELGVAMLSSVLKSKKAAHINIAIMRAFVKLREILAAHKDVAAAITELRRSVALHDKQTHLLLEGMQQQKQPEKPKRQIGFQVKEPLAKYVVRRKR